MNKNEFLENLIILRFPFVLLEYFPKCYNILSNSDLSSYQNSLTKLICNKGYIHKYPENNIIFGFHRSSESNDMKKFM